MRLLLIGIIFIAATSPSNSRTSVQLAVNFRIGSQAIEPCRGADLSVRHVSDDSAMGGHNLSDYAFRNNSTRRCTLKGYPRFELLNKSGRVLSRGRANSSRHLPGDENAGPPELITIDSGKEAVFRVYYNSGGAGRVGKPCPISRQVRIAAPGTTRNFILKEEITSCRTVQVSAMRTSTNVN